VVVLRQLELGQLVHDVVDADVDRQPLRRVVGNVQRRPEGKNVTSVIDPCGVNVMFNIFVDFCLFSTKTLSFS
jgi:hypothetical protein